MPKRLWTDRSAVFIVRTDDGFIPNSPWNFPKTFTDGTLHSLNVPLEDARAIVRSLNKISMERRNENVAAWDHLWAIAVACPRNKWPDCAIRVVTAGEKAIARSSQRKEEVSA